MKKKLMSALLVAAAAISLSSCSTFIPVSATSNGVGSKTATCSQQFVLLFPWNEGKTINQIAKEAGITKITSVDVKTQPLFPVIGKRTIIVCGD